MRKFIWCILIVLAVGAIGYFVGYPFLKQYLEENNPEILEKLGIKTEVIIAKETDLPDPIETDPLEIKSGWTAPEKIEYSARDIPSVENDFYASGFPPFLYVTDDNGQLNQKCEKSFRDDGALIYLYMNDSYYLTKASIEYEVEKSKFNSTSMNEHIDLYLNFIKIITSREVDEADKNALLRVFTNVFNDPESKNNKVTINGLEFRVSLDTFFRLIVLECGN